jgi:hypothetical protein
VSGSFITRTISRLSFSTISFGVLAGAKSPYHCTTSKPGTPLSAIVGSSGKSGDRFLPVTARPRSLPDLMCPLAATRLGNIIWVVPASVSVTAGPDPL